jgi:undecaprenyl diphosphate synthase
MALNYGGRHDIIQAAQKAAAYADGPDFESVFEKSLMTAGIPDPDLLIRTSGEERISNFLLWQCAYTEFIFTETLWPDFMDADFDSALLEFSKRERRYGAVTSSGQKTGG